MQTQRKPNSWIKRLECPVDEDSTYRNTLWCNRDLIPIPPTRRTWTWREYAAYWIITGVNATSWTLASSLLALGLSISQAMGVIVGASLIAALLAVVAGWPGSHHYVGFTVLSRGAWGMRGGFWPLLNRIMTACIWMGIQAYWGGQAVKIILGAVIGPKFVYWRNTLPESAHVDEASLLSFFVFLAVFAPMLLVVPERLRIPFRVAFVMIACTVLGMLVWALSANGGAGTLIHTGPTEQGSILGWNTVYGLQSVIGVFGSGCLGQSDWTRYSKTPNAALFGQIVTAPIAICVTALCGLLVTSATAEIYGEVFWNPFQLLLAIQHNSLSAGARAGTFFAGLGFLASALALCIVTNSVAGGMDLAALYPKYINIRRGSYLITIIAVATCPWQFVTQATTFITVLSGWSVFLSPMTGIVISDYFLVRKQGLHMGDLYLGNSSSAYWYSLGFNWRAVVAWAMGFGPLLPGLIRHVQGSANGSGWDHLNNVSYFYGFFVSLLLHWGLFRLFPTERQTGDSPFSLGFDSESRSYESSGQEREVIDVVDEKSRSVSMLV